MEDVHEAQSQAVEERRAECLARLDRQFDGTREAPAVTPVDPDHIEIGIDDPVFGHTLALVQPPFDRLVALPRPL